MEWCQHRFSDHTSFLESFSLSCGIPGKVVSEKLGYTPNLWGHPNAAQNRAGLWLLKSYEGTLSMHVEFCVWNEVVGSERGEKAQGSAAEVPGLEGPESHSSGVFCVPHLCVLTLHFSALL